MNIVTRHILGAVISVDDKLKKRLFKELRDAFSKCLNDRLKLIKNNTEKYNIEGYCYTTEMYNNGIPFLADEFDDIIRHIGKDYKCDINFHFRPLNDKDADVLIAGGEYSLSYINSEIKFNEVFKLSHLEFITRTPNYFNKLLQVILSHEFVHEDQYSKFENNRKSRYDLMSKGKLTNNNKYDKNYDSKHETMAYARSVFQSLVKDDGSIGGSGNYNIALGYYMILKKRPTKVFNSFKKYVHEYFNKAGFTNNQIRDIFTKLDNMYKKSN
jgi:hypothetical protein